MISSKSFERWLISITDIPIPGSATICARASSKTGTGNTAGPALKLKIRSVISLGEGVRVLGVEVGEITTPYTQNPILSQYAIVTLHLPHAESASAAPAAHSQP